MVLDILQQNQKDCKKCMDKILEFLRLPKYDSDTDEYYQEGKCTKQITLYEFQEWVGKGIETLDRNNNKGRKQSW